MQIISLAADTQQLLSDFAAQLADAGVDVPPAQYVASGIQAWDGEALTVYLGNVGLGQPDVPDGRTITTAAAITLWATFYVQIIRETTGINDAWQVAQGRIPEPDPDVLGAYGQAAISDAAGLIQAAIGIRAAYLDVGPGQGFVIDNVAPLGPDGGLSAQRLTLKVSLS